MSIRESIQNKVLLTLLVSQKSLNLEALLKVKEPNYNRIIKETITIHLSISHHIVASSSIYLLFICINK
jgi:hypothetical protein